MVIRVRTHPPRGISRSQRFARSRPLTLREGGVALGFQGLLDGLEDAF